MDIGSQRIRLFKSKYPCPDVAFWRPILSSLQAMGFKIHENIQPCDKAIILGGYMENPNAFKDIYTVAYLLPMNEITDLWSQILHFYYDDIIYPENEHDTLTHILGELNYAGQ